MTTTSRTSTNTAIATMIHSSRSWNASTRSMIGVAGGCRFNCQGTGCAARAASHRQRRGWRTPMARARNLLRYIVLGQPLWSADPASSECVHGAHAA